MQSISGSAVVAKYDRPLVYAGRPARANSCKRRFLQTALGNSDAQLHRASLRSERRFVLHGDYFGEARARAAMADHARAFDFDPHQQRVAVAVRLSRDDSQAVARAFALRPQLIAGAAEERHIALGKRSLERFAIHESDHQDFAIAMRPEQRPEAVRSSFRNQVLHS